MIIFVGDKASAKNTDPMVAFVGTQSYKKLLEWIFKLDISINNIRICNSADLKQYRSGQIYVEENGSFHMDILLGEDKFIALGKNAEKAIKKLGLDCYYLPHPSGANPKANKSKQLDDKLKDCKKWINGV